MKKSTYITPEIQVIKLHGANLLHQVSNVSNSEGITWKSDGLGSEDDLR